MKYKFNGKLYEKGGGQGTSYGNLLFDIFKYYLANNPNRTYKDIQNIFNPLHKEFSGESSKKRVVFNTDDFDIWYESAYSDSKRDQRYFPSIEYNNEQLYFTTQWGNKSGEYGNINTFIDYIISELNYDIGKIEDESWIYNKLIDVLSNKYNQVLKGQEIIELVLKKYPNTNETSIILTDYCYNKKNRGSSKYELFEYINESTFKYLGVKNDKKSDRESMKVKNIMLYGAPGVGKTHNYKRLISMIENGNDEKTIFDAISKNENTKDFDYSKFDEAKNDKRIEFVTFHQSYSYEDFIEGYRPNEDGKIELEEYGIFKKLVEDAQKSDKNFYIVIDEINRGNISKIFGELITLIEEDKRGKKEYEVTLPYSKKPFLIPKNLYIIATMNSTDKSIATIDIALRRRFTFLKMKPKIGLVPEKAKDLFKNLNEHIINVINEDYQIGHSYFMNDLDIDFIKEYKIKPLLEEYFYGDAENHNKALKILEKY